MIYELNNIFQQHISNPKFHNFKFGHAISESSSFIISHPLRHIITTGQFLQLRRSFHGIAFVFTIDVRFFIFPIVPVVGLTTLDYYHNDIVEIQ